MCVECAGALRVGALHAGAYDEVERCSCIRFPRKYWCIFHCVDVFVIVYYALMDVNVYDILIY
jgi:hypothetical protein